MVCNYECQFKYHELSNMSRRFSPSMSSSTSVDLQDGTGQMALVPTFRSNFRRGSLLSFVGVGWVCWYWKEKEGPRFTFNASLFSSIAGEVGNGTDDSMMTGSDGNTPSTQLISSLFLGDFRQHIRQIDHRFFLFSSSKFGGFEGSWPPAIATDTCRSFLRFT